MIEYWAPERWIMFGPVVMVMTNLVLDAQDAEDRWESVKANEDKFEIALAFHHVQNHLLRVKREADERFLMKEIPYP